MVNRLQVAPDIYFPIEIGARELSGYLLLGARLADEGLNVIIGHKEPVQALIRQAERPGIIYYKGDARTEKFGRTDFAYVGQDPEMGIIYRDYAEFVAGRPFSMGRIPTSDGYFTYGQFDYFHLRTCFESSRHMIHPTGSPRTMLWGQLGAVFFKHQVLEIAERYAPFVLVASRGGRGDRWDRLQNPERSRQVRRTADELLRRAQQVQAATGYNVVIRPHHSEDWREWKRSVTNFDGISIDSAYALSPWIRASEFVVQAPTSTTAFEAWEAGKMAIASEPPQPYIAKDGSRADFIAHLLCVSSDCFLGGSGLDLDAALKDYEGKKSLGELERMVRNRLYTPGRDATREIASVLLDMVDAPSRYDAKPNLMSFGREWAQNPNWRQRINREELARYRPPPEKRWPLELTSIKERLSVAQEVLGIRKEILARAPMRNTVLLSAE